ncbi:MAG: hypothetical protein LJE68_14465 [Rhodobacter sp.]|nr:hypothetical protein [Rhodobacter sp.]
MTEPARDVPAEWRGILRPGERILWQGGPKQAFYWRRQYNSGLFGAGAVLVILFFFLGESETWVIWFMLVLAVVSVIGIPLRDAVIRHHSFFTLTNRRAFIGTDMPVLGRRLNSYPIGAETELRFERDLFSAIYFAHEMKRTEHGEYRVDIGFENIDDGDRVYDLMLQIQKGAL